MKFEINFEIINKLSQRSSKKYIRKLIEYCVLLKKTVSNMDNYFKTPFSNTFSKDFDLD